MSADDLRRERDRVDLLRRRIINVVGHELKLPVSTIGGLAASLATATPEEVRDQIAPALVRSTARLERLVDDLLLASGVTTVLPVEAPAPQPIGPAVERAWAVVGRGDVAVTGDASADVCSRGDALDRILEAVLDNAAKYGRPPVQVAVDGAGDRVTIEVVSGGVPSAEDDLALALEPFFRGEAAVTAAPGLGVGLAVASALAEQQGGRVTIESRDDHVVTTVELPAP
jgi:signal transduction histidine kinase